jgi:hypothetical protein
VDRPFLFITLISVQWIFQFNARFNGLFGKCRKCSKFILQNFCRDIFAIGVCFPSVGYMSKTK